MLSDLFHNVKGKNEYLAGTTNTTQPIKIKMIIRYTTRWRDDGGEKSKQGSDPKPTKEKMNVDGDLGPGCVAKTYNKPHF